MKFIILVGLCFGLPSASGGGWHEGYENRKQINIPNYNRQIYEYRKSEEYLEYIGYRGDYGICDRRYYEDGFSRNRSKSQGYSDRDNYYDYEDEIRKKCDQLYGFTGPTAYDEPENLLRPCALDDWQCIRKYFAAHSKCKPVSGPIPDPLRFDVSTVYYSVAGITVTLRNITIRGLGTAKIREFYVNKKSGNLVFAIAIDTLNETIPRDYFRYRRTAKESIVLTGYATVEYDDTTFTAIIPKIPHLQLHLAEIHAYSGNGFPRFFLSPGLVTSTDPEVIEALARFNLNVSTVVREIFNSQAPLLTAIYIQTNICDFGLEIVNI